MAIFATALNLVLSQGFRFELSESCRVAYLQLPLPSCIPVIMRSRYPNPSGCQTSAEQTNYSQLLATPN